MLETAGRLGELFHLYILAVVPLSAQIDLRSDTVTRPTAAMLDAMRDSSFGDDSRDGDDTVRKLEALAAEQTGKQAAMFLPSGTMANLVAVLTHARRGGEVLLEASAHILNSELGGITAVAGAFYRGIRGEHGAIDPEQLAYALRPATRHNLGTALVCMETTHNAAGGTVLPLEHMRSVYALANERGIPVHTDGARIFNAAAALRVTPATLARHTDSVCFCISKGLSAPVGSLLCGSASYIEQARAFRRMLGGNMRQAGPLAAAGIIAIEQMVDRLRDDHATAMRLARSLEEIEASLVDTKRVQTNIVKVRLPASGRTAVQWSAALSERGVLVSPCERHALRFVTHRHVSAQHIDKTVSVFRDVIDLFETAAG